MYVFKKNSVKGKTFFFPTHDALTLIKSTEEEMKHFGGDKKVGTFHCLSCTNSISTSDSVVGYKALCNDSLSGFLNQQIKVFTLNSFSLYRTM